MAIFLENLNIPEGNPITINIYRDGTWVNAYTTEDGKAIEVPEPHGRLIDADALDIGKMIDVYIRGDLYRHEWNIDEWLNSASTIIPASEE